MVDRMRLLRFGLVVFWLLSSVVSCRTSHISTQKDSSVQIDTSLPDTSGVPDTNIVPDLSGIDLEIPPDVAVDLIEPADTNLPDTTVEDTTLPDTNVPDTNVPDTNVPDTNVPDTNIDLDVAKPDIAQGSDPVLEQKGTNGAYLLKGLIVTPDTTLQGQVLVEQKDVNGSTHGVITCVKADCSSMPAAADATVIETNGLIFPGMIDGHNHILFDVFDDTQWTTEKLTFHHNLWTQQPSYKEMKNFNDFLLNSPTAQEPGINIDCEVQKYGEIKGLIVGTTSILGAPSGNADRNCFVSLARSIDGSKNRLPATQSPPLPNHHATQ